MIKIRSQRKGYDKYGGAIISTITTPSGRTIDPETHILRPGYIETDDHLIRIKRFGDMPERWNGKSWQHYSNLPAVFHGERLTDEEALELARKLNLEL